MYTYRQQALPRVLIHRTTSKEEMEVARTIQPHELKNRVDNTKLPCYTLPATQQHSIF